MEECFPKLGVSCSSFSNADQIEECIQPGKTKLVWLESPTNPTLKITDIEKSAAIAHKHDCILVVDNTFMSPYFQNPLQLGADIVLHSVTKYINGHTDVVMGVLCTNDADLHKRLVVHQQYMGAAPSPFDCYLASRGLRTLALRMRQHDSNALGIAKFLESHEYVKKTIYPGLCGHPQHELAKTQMRGFGGMITFYIRGGMTSAKRFLESCNIVTAAVSLGAVETLVEHPASMTHNMVKKEVREKIGISDSLLRLSVGIEDMHDIISDLDQALESAASAQTLKNRVIREQVENGDEEPASKKARVDSDTS